MIDLPGGIQACLFDLDGVLTKTAAVHAAAWQEMFDGFLRQRAEAAGGEFRPFDLHDDYDEYVDGKPREDGVRDFLRSRGISLPEGTPSEPAGAETVYGLGNRKTELLLKAFTTMASRFFDGSVRFLQAVQQAGLHRDMVAFSAKHRPGAAGPLSERQPPGPRSGTHQSPVHPRPDTSTQDPTGSGRGRCVDPLKPRRVGAPAQ